MIYAIILSGGIGLRMGSSRPKQYIEVNGKPIISYAISPFFESGLIDHMVISVNNDWRDYVSSHVGSKKNISYSEPGETREHTIYNALRHIRSLGANDSDIVIIHDAVRPLVSIQVIKDCLSGCSQYDGAIATISVKDTIYVSANEKYITDIPNRSTLHAGQTPEAFNFGKYLKIHDESSYEEIVKVTGGAQFAAEKGLSIYLSKGEEINFKITTPEDLQRFNQIISERNEKNN